MSTNNKVIVWSKTGCHHCEKVKELLAANGVPYENISVDGNEALRNVLDVKYGIRHVPVVEVGGNGRYEAWTNLELDQLESLVTAQLA